MDISKTLHLECCNPDFKAGDKDSALRKLAQLMKNAKALQDINEDVVYQALKQREDVGSTGFGKGIAIPHCQLKGLTEFVLGLATSSSGVHFDAMDKKKVKIFVVILGPEKDRSGHLQLLAKVSSVLKESGIQESLLNASSKIALYEEFLRNSEHDLHIKTKGRSKLMLMVIKDVSIVEDITEIFLEFGIQDTTIIETQQMENLLSKVPLFMGFFNFTGEKNPYSKLIMLKIDKNYLNALVKSIEDRFGDLDNYTGLSLMVLDLFFSKG